MPPKARPPLGPLTHLSFYILLALAEGHQHGYAIVKSVRERSRGAVSPGTGTFYSAIHRMTEEGLIAEVPRPPEADSDDSRRRYYRLTARGRRAVQAETSRLEQLVADARMLIPMEGR